MWLFAQVAWLWTVGACAIVFRRRFAAHIAETNAYAWGERFPTTPRETLVRLVTLAGVLLILAGVVTLVRGLMV